MSKRILVVDDEPNVRLSYRITLETEGLAVCEADCAKKALEQKVPQEIIKRKKAGFPVPYDTWLRTDLKDWLASILLDSRTISRGYFNRSSVESLIRKDQQDGGYSKELFSLATLELWQRTFMDQNQPVTS